MSSFVGCGMIGPVSQPGPSALKSSAGRFVLGTIIVVILMPSYIRLLRFVGHLTPRPSRARAPAPHSYVFAFRRLPVDWPALCGRLLRGVSRDALEDLALRLVEHASARARRVEVQQHLDAVRRFFAEEASPLAAAIAATGYARYPVPQHERDALLLRYRDAHRLAPAPASRAR